MVICRQLMELDVFKNVELIAGKKGLDKEVTWVYAKQTKNITPWVYGGEFLLVSGYEYAMGEEELLHLIEESAMNNLSGILVEGGINFKEIPDRVIKKADEEGIPLFFVKGVISFLDVTRDIIALIMERKYLAKRNTSLLDQLLNSPSLSQKEIDQLLYGMGIPPDSYFLVAVFSISDNIEENKDERNRVDRMISFSRNLQKHVDEVFVELELKELSRLRLESVDYLIYADNEKDLLAIAEKFKKIRKRICIEEDNSDVYLSFSSIIHDNKNIINGFNEAHFTRSLLQRGLFPDRVKSFSDIGSYQMIFHIEDRGKLINFRDKYLKELYEIDKERSSQLLETLREYLINDGNILQTSKKLYIHRNTLQYRMDRIKEILNVDISDFNIKRDLLNAFMILDIFPFS